MIILHVLLSMQTHWYGYVVDAIVIIILGVFIPIAPLRHGLSSFFKIIMLNANALLHLGVCLLLGVSFSLIGLEILKKSSFI